MEDVMEERDERITVTFTFESALDARHFVERASHTGIKHMVTVAANGNTTTISPGTWDRIGKWKWDMYKRR